MVEAKFKDYTDVVVWELSSTSGGWKKKEGYKEGDAWVVSREGVDGFWNYLWNQK